MILGGITHNAFAENAKLTLLHDLSETDERGTAGSLIQGADGNFYGMEYGHNGTSAFRITPSGEFTYLHRFFGKRFEGLASDLIRARRGGFYGTAFDPGQPPSECERPGGCNYIFRLSETGALTTVYSFEHAEQPFVGLHPSGLTEDSDGNLYGVALNENSQDVAVIFKLTPAGTLVALASLRDCKSMGPSHLLMASDGNLYGTYSCLPTEPTGVIFKITPSGVLSTLHAFSGTDGSDPGGLIQGRDGDFYGITGAGAEQSPHCWATGCGTAFKFSPSGALTTLHYFTGGSDGGNPEGALLQGEDGKIYGSTSLGGKYTAAYPRGGNGVIFEIVASGSPTVIYSFKSGGDLHGPGSRLVQTDDGSLYGTTIGGGIFRLNLTPKTPAKSVITEPAKK
ncbi:MAG: choice-of-anchor tandem repeat GloVer-containing protein [Steroidobacteraceae bacterium]